MLLASRETAEIVETTAQCPACRGALVRLMVRGGLVSGCRGCGGAWLDAAACNIAAKAEVFEETRAFIRMLDASEPPRQRTVFRDLARSKSSARLCPECAEPLTERYLREPNVTLDVCPQHGTFFDRHELGRVIESVEIRAAAWAGRAAGRQDSSLGRENGMKRPGGTLLRVGAGLFIVSLLLPSVTWRVGSGSQLPGGICAVFGCFLIAEPAVFICAVANLFVALAPVYARRLRTRGAAALSLGVFSTGVLALSIAFGDARRELLVGYWVWVVSFFVIAIGFAARAAAKPSDPALLAQ